MLKIFNGNNPNLVDLTDKVSVRTAISQENHPALRSGFAGYPANPRWNVNKYRAWKAGRQLRDALKQGSMVVRQSDCLLVPATEQEEGVEDKPPSRLRGVQLEGWKSLWQQVVNDYRLV